VNQSGSFNTTIYVGNLVPFVSQSDLIPLFQGFGYIVEIRMQPDRGFAFIKLDSHENAANAIVNLQGTMVHGRGLKCSWGKDRNEGGGGGGGGGLPPQSQSFGSVRRTSSFHPSRFRADDVLKISAVRSPSSISTTLLRRSYASTRCSSSSRWRPQRCYGRLASSVRCSMGCL